MTHAYYYDVPASPDVYRKVRAEIGPQQPPGLISHLVVRHDGGLRHYGVWESQGDWERFRDARVRPAVATVLAGSGVPATAPPVEHVLEVVDVDISHP